MYGEDLLSTSMISEELYHDDILEIDGLVLHAEEPGVHQLRNVEVQFLEAAPVQPVAERVEGAKFCIYGRWERMPFKEGRVFAELVFRDPADLVGTAGSDNSYFH